MKKHTFNKVYGYWEAVLSFCWRQQPGKSGEVWEKRGKHRISHSRQVQLAKPIELGGLCLAWTPQLSSQPCWHCSPSFIFHFRLLHVLLLPWDSQTPWEVSSPWHSPLACHVHGALAPPDTAEERPRLTPRETQGGSNAPRNTHGTAAPVDRVFCVVKESDILFTFLDV